METETIVPLTTIVDGKKELFLKDLQSHSQTKLLAQEIAHKKNCISISVYKLSNDDTSDTSDTSDIINEYLVAIKGRLDNVMIALAKKSFRLPRGLFCYWVPNQSLEFFGFLPKFENDREYQVDDQGEFTGATQLRISLKSSGSLGMRHVCTSVISGKKLVFYTSKKATGNEYSKKFRQLVEIKVKNLSKLDQWQANTGLTICAEVCFENSHGAMVIDPNFFVTVISQAKKINLSNGNVNGATGNALVEYLPDTELVNYCHLHTLPIDDRIIINGLENCSIFTKSISQHRDQMTIDHFYHLIKQLENDKILTIIDGNIKHQRVFGLFGALEGLIIHMIGHHNMNNKDNDDKKHQKIINKTIKYKFPNYTSRTFGVRSAVWKGPIEYRDHVNDYVKRWVLTPEGRNYWTQVLFGAFEKIPRFNSQEEINHWVNSGGHIQAVDWGKEHPVKEKDFLSLMKLTVKDGYSAHLVIVIGPIGSGKSTIASSIVSEELCVDGDKILGLTAEKIIRLGQERSAATVWEVVKTLAIHGLCVISTGGGVLKNISGLLKSFFPGIYVNITVMFPIFGGNREFKIIEDRNQALQMFIDTVEMASMENGLTEDTIRRRIDLGEWSLPSGQKIDQFIKQIITKVNRGNIKFAQEFITLANQIIVFDVVTPEQFSKNSGLFQIPSNLPKFDQGIGIDKINITQQRLLVEYYKPTKSASSVSFGHITEEWRPRENPKIIDKSFIMKRINIMDDDQWKMISFANGKMSLLIPPDDKDLVTAHVTIQSGVHFPSVMTDVTKAIKEKHDTITLIDRNNKEVTYKLPSIDQSISVKARIVARFCL